MMSTCQHIARCGLVLILVVGPRVARGQKSQAAEGIEPFRFRVTETYLDINAEGEQEVQEQGQPPATVNRHRIILQPALGAGVNGSIYHPNFLNLDLAAELGLDWQNAGENPGTDVTESHLLQRYHGTLDFMRQQGYATTLFADKDMTYRDYDFFNRVRVDSQRYGGRSGYSSGPVPFSLTAQHYDEVTEDLSRPSSFKENRLTLSAQNLREAAQGQTQLSYDLNVYQRQDNGFSNQSGLNQNLSVFDSEGFSGSKFRLTSLLNYNGTTETTVPNSKLLAQENLRIQHSEKLSSFYEYVFDSSTSGDSDSQTHQGRLGLTHQLYENLTSTPDLHGYITHATSPGDELDTRRYGPALTEQYSRPISTWGNISAGYSGGIDREERDASGTTLNIIDELHILTDGVITFLNQLSVDVTTLQVTDPTRSIIYVQGLDYRTFPRGLLTQIERVPGGRIANGGAILASYTAVLQPSAKFWAYQNGVNVRFDFWKGLLGVYFRWIYMDFDGAEQLQLRTLNDKIFGADTTWRWFRAGGEYEIADSNIAPYTRARLYQSFTYKPSDGTVLSLDLDQRWSVFRENDMRETSYGFMLRAQVALRANLNWNTEAGIRIDRGDTFDGDLGVVRTGVTWRVGKLNLNVGYEYGYESHPSDLRERHYAFFRARRYF